MINKAAWLERHGLTGGPLLMKPWETTNQLKVQQPLLEQLQRHLMALMPGQADGEQTETSEQLMQTLICCFSD